LQHVTVGLSPLSRPRVPQRLAGRRYEKDPVTGSSSTRRPVLRGASTCTLACPYGTSPSSTPKGDRPKCDMCSERLRGRRGPRPAPRPARMRRSRSVVIDPAGGCAVASRTPSSPPPGVPPITRCRRPVPLPARPSPARAGAAGDYFRTSRSTPTSRSSLYAGADQGFGRRGLSSRRRPGRRASTCRRLSPS